MAATTKLSDFVALVSFKANYDFFFETGTHVFQASLELTI